MKYSLRSLTIVTILAPALLAGGWCVLTRIQQDSSMPRIQYQQPTYKDHRATRIMIRYEKEHGPLKTIGN